MVFELDRTVATAIAWYTNATAIALVADAMFLRSGAVVRTDLHVTIDADVTRFAETVAVAAFAVPRTVAARHYHIARIKTFHFVQLLIMYC